MDMSLDEIIQKNMSFSRGGRLGDERQGGSRGIGGSKRGAGAWHFQSNGAVGGGSSGGGGPMRRRGSRARHANGFNPYSKTYDTYEGPKRRQLKGSLSTTNIHKIVISNLDFGVISSDIQELFQEFGPLKTATVHYDISGRSLGTADVVFKNKNSALKAVRRYNNVSLDGRPMKIKLATDLSNVANIANRLTRPAPLAVRGLVKIIIVEGGRGNRGKRGNTRSTSRRRRAGRGGRKNRKNKLNKDRLDAQLDSFIRSNNN